MSKPAIPHRHSILAVDDTPANLELLVECLSPHYEVRVATSGERALKLCEQRLPDLIVLDVMMPGMDGFEVLRRLKRASTTSDVPVIFATAKDDKADEQIGLELGAADYVAKPIHVPVLLARVATHLALYDHRRHLERLVRQRSDDLGQALMQVEEGGRVLQDSRARLEFLHSHDTLTSLPNQQFFFKRMSEEMRHGLMNGGRLAIINFNIDRLRNLNQSLGVAVGDALLVEIAQLLQRSVSLPDVAARISGDEFVLMLTSQPSDSDTLTNATDRFERRIGNLAESVLLTIAAPKRIQDNTVAITASCGIAFFPEDAANPSQLLSRSQQATATAKQAGRNRLARYHPSLVDNSVQRFALQGELRRVIAERKLRPYYQPKVHADSGALVGAEALARWPLEGGEFRSPGEFIPLAEEYGLIEALDDLIMKEVMIQLAEWKPRLPPDFRIAVNVSSNRFHDDGFAPMVGKLLQETGADARHLELEITEGALIGDIAGCLRNLKALRELGIDLALDDFGTGYSSLSYLKQLPLQKLKVDQSFVRDIERDPNDAAIVQAVLALASALKLETIAEGVEKVPQLEFVRDLGCKTIQGFLFSPAVSAANFSALLDAGRVEIRKTKS